MTTTKRSPCAYSGEGSAIADYFRQEKQPSLPTKKEENWGLFNNNNSQHKRILATLRTANIVVKNEKWGEVADMEGWFNQFLKSNKSPVNKPLKKMTSLEVSKIIKALDGVAIWKNSI
ncbi:hypothetical protein [Flavobacterium soyangense]|uniref:Uncharacterized protein n=1 Tax=Flavobacterium soyangense TaxID=2023265 RepID=A0A930UD64_9FLAO|nr:hypothetical protein [Flavobacterium soyangense]MBF2710032.1 hypothetical protein [Flavobacterium soyangense]